MFRGDSLAYSGSQGLIDLVLKPSPKTLLVLCCYILFSVADKTFVRRIRPKNVEVTIENQHECLLKKITPFYNIPYSSELEKKQETGCRIISDIKDRLSSHGTLLPDFPVEKIIPSPQVTQYRNKDDFSVYHGMGGHNRTVGYLTGTPALPGCFAVRPTHLSHIKDSHKRLAKLFEEYVTQSPYTVCYNFRDGGFWKRLTVRSTEAGEMMAIVVTHPYSLTVQQMADERQRITKYLLSHEPDLILYHQECEKVDCTSDLSSYVQLAGKTSHLVEKMGNFSFQISPHSFFQVNKKAAEQLVNTVWSDMDVTNETTFLDLYCGVGLYSIMGSHLVQKAVGVEQLEGAVVDARKNAKLNNITNCEFIAGRVETNLSQLLSKNLPPNSQLMTLLNPGRAGVTKKVISAIRGDKRIKKLIYVSCKPDNQFTTNNFFQLCRKGSHMRGTPFYLKKVQMFDLFPRTAHFEMILEFNRCD